MNSLAPRVVMNSGATVPQVGFGVFQVDPTETTRVVLDALAAGYRHIDTAAGYSNEEQVGKAIAESGIPRSELFVTTKQRPADQAAGRSRAAIESSLEKLGLDYVDLYLIHWPTPARGLYVESWLALEGFAREGLARSIGVSNFLPEHLDRLAAEADVVPAVNQIELHPRFQQRHVADHTTARGILVEAWSPIARGTLVDTPEVVAIAAKYHKSVAQVTLRWHLDNDRIVIPRTTRKERMSENLDLFDFTLTTDEHSVLASLELAGRIGPDPATMNNA